MKEKIAQLYELIHKNHINVPKKVVYLAGGEEEYRAFQIDLGAVDYSIFVNKTPPGSPFDLKSLKLSSRFRTEMHTIWAFYLHLPDHLLGLSFSQMAERTMYPFQKYHKMKELQDFVEYITMHVVDQI